PLLHSFPTRRSSDLPRSRAIIELLYATGIRVSELCNLNLLDVGDEVIRVRGKGNKERIVPIAPSTLLTIDAYLTNHPADDLITRSEEHTSELQSRGH